MAEITSYRFDRFRLDLRRASLLRDETAVALRPKAFDVLLYLVRNAGRVVSKEELLREAWPRVIVTDNSLAQCVREIREALGDEDQSIVATSARRGYVFAAPVSASAEAVAPARDRPSLGLRVSIAALAVAAVAASSWLALRPAPRAGDGRLAVAVMPFAAAPGEEYFSRGVSGDIAAALGRFPELAVSSPEVIARLQGSGQSGDDVPRELHARYVVEGNVMRAPDKVRIAVRLAEWPRGVLLWSEAYEASAADMISTQERITAKVAGALAVNVANAAEKRATAKPAGSLEAYDLLFRGRERQARLNRTAQSQARALFEQALARDGNLAPAYVGLGRVELTAVALGWTDDAEAALDRAEHSALRAISLDETDARAHVLLGRTYARQGQYDRAVDTLRRAVALNRSDPDAWAGLGDALLWSGELSGAIDALETALAADPRLSAEDLFSLGAAYFLAGREGDSIRVLERATAREDGTPYIYALLAADYARTGRADDAHRAALEARRMNPFFDQQEFGSLFRRPEDREKLAAALRTTGL